MNALTAHELEERILDYVYDELSPEERAAFEAALPSAPAVAAEVAAMQRTRDAMGSLGPPPGATDLLGGMDAIFAEAGAMAASMAAQQAPPQVAKTRVETPQTADAPGGGIAAWFAKAARAFHASLMTPAFGAAAAVLIVAGVAVILSRSGRYPGEDRSAESQTLGVVPPVAVAEAPPSAVKPDETGALAGKAEEASDMALAVVADAPSATDGVSGLANEPAAPVAFMAEDLKQGVRSKRTETVTETRANEQLAAGLADGRRGADKGNAGDSAARRVAAADSGGSQAGRGDEEAGPLEWRASSGSGGSTPTGDAVAMPNTKDADQRPTSTPSNAAQPPAATTYAYDDVALSADEVDKAENKPMAPPTPKPTVQTASKTEPEPSPAKYAQTAAPAPTDREEDTARKPASRQAPARPSADSAPSRPDEAPTEEALAERESVENLSKKSDADRKAADDALAQRIEALWATFKRQVDARDVASSRKTLAALESLGADAARIKAAKAQVADLERRLIDEYKKALPATRSTK